jgi:hypothetical protein
MRGKLTLLAAAGAALALVLTGSSDGAPEASQAANNTFGASLIGVAPSTARTPTLGVCHH